MQRWREAVQAYRDSEEQHISAAMREGHYYTQHETTVALSDTEKEYISTTMPSRGIPSNDDDTTSTDDDTTSNVDDTTSSDDGTTSNDDDTTSSDHDTRDTGV